MFPFECVDPNRWGTQRNCTEHANTLLLASSACFQWFFCIATEERRRLDKENVNIVDSKNFDQSVAINGLHKDLGRNAVGLSKLKT